jgi:hypothetical protein
VKQAIKYTLELNIFSGFAKLREKKMAISFVMPVRRSVPMEQRGSHSTDFHEIWYLSILRKTHQNSSFIKLQQE